MLSTPQLNRTVAANISWLFAVQAAVYVCPLMNVLFLTRALGPAAWGTLATFQALASCLSLVVEYGFGLSATREVAQNRDNREALELILASVLAAKLALGSVLVLALACCYPHVPILGAHPLLTVCAAGVALASSFTPLWFYQGLELIRPAAIVDLIGRMSGTLLTVIIVRHPSQVWLALVIPGIAGFSSTALNHLQLYRTYRFILPSPQLVMGALKLGWSMFLYRSSVSLYTIGNSFILALFVAPEYVGYYSAAERVARCVTSVVGPISQAVLPRISYLVETNLKQAAIVAQNCFRFTALLGLAAGTLTFLAAPAITSLLLGRKFAEATPALRILSLLPPLIAMSNILGFQWLFPLRRDSAINATILSAGLLNLVLSVALAPIFRQQGMACAVVAAETFVTVSFLGYLKVKGLSPGALARIL